MREVKILFKRQNTTTLKFTGRYHFILQMMPCSFSLELHLYRKATTQYLYIICIYGVIRLQILFLKHHILLFCHEILKFFS
jgi:hypothetical protein